MGPADQPTGSHRLLAGGLAETGTDALGLDEVENWWTTSVCTFALWIECAREQMPSSPMHVWLVTSEQEQEREVDKE